MTNIISKREQAVENIVCEHERLHNLLNDLKVRSGLQPDKYVSPINPDKVKAVYQKYEKLLPVSEDEVIQMFNSCGYVKSDFDIIKSKPVKFSADNEAAKDEAEFFSKMNFVDVTVSERQIIDLINKDNNISPEIIAKVLKTTPEYVTGKIAGLTKSGVLESKTIKVGEDTQIRRTLTIPIADIIKPPAGRDMTEVLIKYSYEGPKDDRNRPFCAKMLELDRLYSRKEIENISLRLGYSVFDRRGGWWTMPDGTHSPSCRHRWQSNVIVKKRKP